MTFFVRTFRYGGRRLACRSDVRPTGLMLGVLGAFGLLAASSSIAADDFFATRIEPVLRKHCFECHSHAAGQLKGGLTLDSRSGWAEGGDSGPAIVPGKPNQSLLIAALRHESLEMPPKKKLPDAVVADFVRWIESGAVDPRVRKATVVASSETSPTAWWSLRPLSRPAVPAGATHPIDAFLRERLSRLGIAPSTPADRTTLVRRLTYTLHGLPPTPEATRAFERDDRPDAYDRLVDQLLASPRYGERWARHWLDVVHYGESNGFGMDRPRMSAWPYRDYVVAALNADKPYARFVQEQLAADSMFPDSPQLTPALGFAAAGPFNQSALVEQVDGTECKRIALNLDRDDMVASTCSTFLSLTVHCARCHAHKFDPISQRDYYQLQAVFAGVGRAERSFDADPRLAARRATLRTLIADLEKNPDSHPPTAQERTDLAPAQAEWEKSLAAEAARWTPLAVERVESSHAKTEFLRLDDGSWLAAGEAAEKDTYVIHARVALPTITAVRLELLPDDRLPLRGPGRQANGNLHLSEIRVRRTMDDKPQPLVLQNASADFNQAGWGVERAIDGKPETAWGIHPQVGTPHQAVFEVKPAAASLAAPTAAAPASANAPPAEIQLFVELDQLHGQRHLVGRFRLSATDKPLPVRTPSLAAELLNEIARPESQRSEAARKRLFDAHRMIYLKRRLEQLPAEQKVWAIAADFPPRRNYKPVGEPYPIAVLRRGDIRQPQAVVGPGALAAVATLSSEFSLDNPRDEGARRAALARWITAPENMLAWRSIVNRAWHWHFGRGLVDTPNDLGRMGSPPSHPELLDWLASEFRDQGGSLKRLHRSIVTSAAYRQASAHRDDAARIDGDNRFLWRMNRQRLDAECVRDSLLAVSGKLDLVIGGPSAMQFQFKDPNMNVTPQIDYGAFDPDSPASRRRGVYRFLFRNLNDPLLDAFDAVDPSLSVPKRDITITPLQALSLWNNRFVLRQCEHLAERLEREADGVEAQVALAVRLVCTREPTDAERALLVDYARRHGLKNVCRVLVNSNDFLFVN